MVLWVCGFLVLWLGGLCIWLCRFPLVRKRIGCGASRICWQICFGGGFLVEAIIFFVYFFFYAFSGFLLDFFV